MTRSYFSFMFALLLAAFMAPGVLQAEETSEKQNSEKQTLEATVTISVVSDDKGNFSFPAAKLEPGSYTLRIRNATAGA